MNWNAYSAPETLPPLSGEPVANTPPLAKKNPSLLETMAFFTLAGIVLVTIQAFGAAVVLHWHLFGGISLKKLVYEPRFTIPLMAVSYGVVLLATSALFRRVWSMSFFSGIHWNFSAVSQNWKWLPLVGLCLGLAIQLASNYLPVPKELPVDAFFRNAPDAWMVALFGVFIAPIAEEIAFRGFLFPALRHWIGVILAAILTSVPFAFLHADQVGHAWGPLAMVFLVSLVLCAVRQRIGSVAASALVHASYNFSIFLVIFYASGGFMHLERLKD